jgi:hypothetical protein
MTEYWVAVDIFLEDPSKSREFILKVRKEFMPQPIKEIAKQLTFLYCMTSWHYLFEPQIRLRFEFCDQKVRDEFKDALEVWLRWQREISRLVFDLAYAGEEATYGVEGWQFIKKILCDGSEAAIKIMQDEELWGKREFYLSRYWHLFHYQLMPPEHPLVWLKEVQRYVNVASGYLRAMEDAYANKPA